MRLPSNRKRAVADDAVLEAALGRRRRLRWPEGLWRPSFAAATVAFALIVMPSFGFLAAHYSSDRAVARELAREADEAARQGMLADGWQPIQSGAAAPVAQSVKASLGVELLAATRPFRLTLIGGALSGRAPDAERLERAVRAVAAELARYPKAFLGASRFERVLFCAGLEQAKLGIPSLPNYEHTLLLDVDAPPAFLRRLLDHELFHFADFADDGQVQHDPAWAKLNDHYFVYGDGGRFMRGPGVARLQTNLPGFVSKYATSALEEDKAETFAFMMVAPHAIARIAARDPIVHAKVRAIRAQLVRLSPVIDDAFWRYVATQTSR
jgi:hypothetical protein